MPGLVTCAGMGLVIQGDSLIEHNLSHIDSIAKQGVQFSQAYASASVCGPSRSGLLTGVYQQRFGCGENPNGAGYPDPDGDRGHDRFAGRRSP